MSNVKKKIKEIKPSDIWNKKKLKKIREFILAENIKRKSNGKFKRESKKQ